jgi:hypothetical protein
MARCDDEIAHDLLHALDRHGYTIVKKTVPLPALRTGHSEVRTLVGGMTLVTHKQADCIAPCPVHAPSAHHMIAWRQLYRFDRGIMERNCEHGIGHPDPDDFAIINGTDDGTHGCDGCCVPLPQA